MGGDFWSAALAAGVGHLGGMAMSKTGLGKFGQAAGASVLSGTTSVISGGSFFEGAVTGLIVHMCNRGMHEKPDGNRLHEFMNKAFKDYKYKDRVILIHDDAKVQAVGEKKGLNISAYTDLKNVKDGKYNIYFSDNSLSSNWQLYQDMGHELMHVGHKINLGNKFVVNYSEYTCHMWNYLNYTDDEFHLNEANRYFNSDLMQNQAILKNVIKRNYQNYGNFGIYSTIPRFVYY